MQPYQQASRELQKRNQQDTRVVGGLAAGAAAIIPAAAKLAGSAAIASRVMPLLNNYIPQSLAIKGLSKINPTLGKFVETAIDQGHSFEEAKDFIKNKISPEEEPEKKAEEERNIIQQYSPELHQFIDQEIKSGRDPLQAGALAQHDKRFSSAISKLTKDHKAPWSSILEFVYGQQIAQNQQQQAPEQVDQQNAPKAQPGSGQQALMAILDKINQRLGQ